MYERTSRDGSGGRDMHMHIGKFSSERKNKGRNDIVVV